MSKNSNSRSKSVSQAKTVRSRGNRSQPRVREFDSRHTLGPVASLLLRTLAARPLTLDQLSRVHASPRRSLRGLVDRGLVVEQVAKDGTVRFALSAETSRTLRTVLSQARTPGVLGLVVTGVSPRDRRRSRRTRTFRT